MYIIETLVIALWLPKLALTTTSSLMAHVHIQYFGRVIISLDNFDLFVVDLLKQLLVTQLICTG